MKKLSFLLLVFLSVGVRAQWVSIPDTGFGGWLFSHGFNQSLQGNSIVGWQMDTTHSAVVNGTSISIPNYYLINDLTGIQYFDNLSTLEFRNHSITSLPALPSNLMELYCSGNQIINLPALPNTMSTLDCTDNQISILPALPNTLLNLFCENNQLSALPVLPNTLIDLFCSDNQLSILPSLPSGLRGLYCGVNQLSNLPALPNSLIQLSCPLNSLNSLPVLPNSLRELYCFDNQLSSLPNLTNSLTKLHCYNNQLTSLPNLPNSLTWLYCNDNQLTSLPPFPDSLYYCHVYNNPINCFPQLKRIGILNFTNTNITCLPNYGNVATSIPPLNTLPLCDLFNSNGCELFYNISGKVYFDANSNCQQDSAESAMGNASVMLWSAGNLLQQTLTNNAGEYSFDTDSFGVYYITVDTFPASTTPFSLTTTGTSGNGTTATITFATQASVPFAVGTTITVTGVIPVGYNGVYVVTGASTSSVSFASTAIGSIVIAGNVSTNIPFRFTVSTPFEITCPASGVDTSILTALDSLDHGVDFAVGCKPGFDLAAWSIEGRFRPGNTRQVSIHAGDLNSFYNMHCAAGISGNITVEIIGPATYVSPAPGALTPDNVSGNVITYNVADFGTVDFNSSFNIMLQTDTIAAIGNTICFIVSVSPVTGDDHPINNIQTHCFIVVGSFDPNDKQVYPFANIDTAQEWLTYTIRFQNTGTAEAQHIYVTDTLDSDLDASSFQLLAYSHQPMVQIKENVVRFNFPNINLPDSNTNEPLSHGYVQYKIKLKDNLPTGTEINNTAFIYFDFNEAVVTNTTTNTIAVISGIAASHEPQAVRIYPNPASDVVTISVDEEMIGSMATVTDITGRKIAAVKLTTVNGQLTTDNFANGVYFVTVTDKEGTSATKKLIISK